jgi:hypothetical protein
MPVPGTTVDRGAISTDADIGISASQQPFVGQSEADQKLAEKIVKRQVRLEDERALVDSTWDLIDNIGTSRRAVYDLGQTRGRLVGEKIGEKIYDGTMSAAGQDLADGLQGQTAIKGLTWWAAHLRDKTAQKDYMMRQWIDDIQDCALTEMGQSDLYDQDNEATQDAVFMGTATMDKPIWLPELGRLHYQTRHPREMFIARDDNGIINLRHRKFPMTLRNIADKFGEDKLDLKLRQAVINNPFSRRMVIHAMYLNTERDTRKWTAENKRIASVYVLESEKLILRKSGFDEWPQMTWCWRLNSQETYGRGPAMDTIFESATLNSAMHYLLDAAQLAVQRPMVADESLKSKIKIGPYGITWVTGNEGASIRELFKQNPDYPIAMDSLMKMRDELRDKFKAKTFMLLSHLTEMTQRMNMMQIAEIKGEKASQLGPIIGRREFELLGPIINSTVAVLIKNGRAPRPPITAMQYANSPMDLEFLGPIATALKRFVQTQGLNPFISRLIGDGIPLLQVWPEMKDKIKPDELFDMYFEADGAPMKVGQDPAALAQIRAAKLKQQEAMRKMAMAKEAADGYSKATKAPEPGSPGEQLMNQGGGQ